MLEVDYNSELKNAMSSSERLVGDLDIKRLIWVPDKFAEPKLRTRDPEARIYPVSWKIVVQVTTAIFGRPIFTNEKIKSLEAGCLFVALCLRRAGIEDPTEGFGYKWRSEILGCEIADKENSDHRPIRADEYLGFAWVCFLSGLADYRAEEPVPQLKEIPEKTWLKMVEGLQPGVAEEVVKKAQKLCIETAKNLRNDAFEKFTKHRDNLLARGIEMPWKRRAGPHW
ncbi:hypothetical protein VFPPC_01468 [Pochonia chlamydosporia 170]|uniref:Uncharacterized protein n=1 Tax=Pochonia chlamydosporia 170 TaxID=1380566 RepID=A0A179G8P2_METCM|nr:hypothetical protein VFPPC_01468 [Pochonia chlamydosporia 170]OAQ73860.1 hypothetical protein VFPPC_01468 [Pochonia chlamydosporia 170]